MVLLAGISVPDKPAWNNVTAAAPASISKPVSQKAAAAARSAAARELGEESRAKPGIDPASSPIMFGRTTPTDARTADARDSLIPQSVFGSLPMPLPDLSVDGLINFDNVDAYGLLFLPPDMTGDIGPGHYVQAVNALFRVYDRSGVPQTQPIRLNKLFEPLGTLCSVRYDGLPNVLYDPLADRWLISQTCSNFPPFRQLIAISVTGDPGGEYHLYEFVMPNVRLNDFPKFGVWPDGYYMSTDEFLGSDYYGSGMFAFDRAKMLAGDPTAGYIYFSRPDPVAIRRRGMLPSDLDGLRPPPEGTPNIFVSYTATEYGDPADALRVFDFRADFAEPERSTFIERQESPIAVAAFDPTSPDGRADIAQPWPGERLDSQSDRLNHRLAYRNHGTHESLVTNQTVRMTAVDQVYRAGVRVYELRRSGGQFTVHEQATLGNGHESRWIASAAQDHRSNLAVQYNHVTDEKEPSVLYSGRLAADAPGEFRPEAHLVEGTGVQRAFGWRWGEYSGMSVDPVDDCTFWMTNAYYTQESEEQSEFTWLTRIGNFKFPECDAAPRSTFRGNVTNASNGDAVENAAITLGAMDRHTSPAGSFGPLLTLPGSYPLTVSAHGYRTLTGSITLAANEDRVETYQLEPIPVAVVFENSLTAESCTINSVPEPGETVTMAISLRNSGARDAGDLTARVLDGSGVILPGPIQHFGAVPAGGPPITREFTFTIDPRTACGELITLRLEIRDGSDLLEILQIPLRTGTRSVAFRENFDQVTAPALPAGWSTSSSPNHQLWRTATARTTSGNNAVFSPAPLQRGVNELESPPFEITTDDAELSFSNWYEIESTFLRNRLYDGSVLEIKIGSTRWQDIIDAGGRFITGGYDGMIDACCSNPLARRFGWSGRSGIEQTPIFIESAVKLPAAAKGRTVRLRWRIGTDIGGFREGQYIDDIRVTDGYECSCLVTSKIAAPYDFDGDGRTDLSLFDHNDAPERPDVRIFRSSDQTLSAASFGSSGDMPVYADHDGDGRADLSIFRPSEGTWYVVGSSNGALNVSRFGLSGDIPVATDYDGDGRDDIAVYRPSTGVWYLLRSSAGLASVTFGVAGDIPIPADHDGDRQADVAIFRPGSGEWYIVGSRGGEVRYARFGQAGDIPVAGDFDGDRTADLAVFRPAEATWYILRSSYGFVQVPFGAQGDIPVEGDFDGDGKADIGVFRPSDQTWFYIQSKNGEVRGAQFGQAGELPIPGRMIP